MNHSFESRPVGKREEDLAARLNRLAAEGVLLRQPTGGISPHEVEYREGALQRFLDERHGL